LGLFLNHPVLQWRLLWSPPSGTKAVKAGLGSAWTSPVLPLIGRFGEILAHRERNAGSAPRGLAS
jgi:hypothetical protein